MIPWTAEFVAKILNEASVNPGHATVIQNWTTEDVLRITRHNAAYLYGI